MRLVVLPALFAAACAGDPSAPDDGEPIPDTVPPPPPCAAGPSGTPLHRVSNLAFDRALRDVFGPDLGHPGDALPDDPVTDGYDSTSRGQSLGDAWLAQAFRIAGDVAEQVVEARSWELRFEAEDLALPGDPATVAGDGDGAWWWVRGDAAVRRTIEVPFDGDYAIGAFGAGIILWDDIGDPPAGVWPKISVSVDDRLLGQISIADEDTGAPLRAILAPLTPGTHTIRWAIDIAFPYVLQLDALAVELRPQRHADRATPLRRALIPCDPDEPTAGQACLRDSLARVGRRLWRRPLSPEELDALVSLVRAARSTDEGLARAVHRLVSSPHFLLLPQAPGDRPLDAWEIAARLADVLWASVPDDALLDCAAAGGLGVDEATACGLTPQIERMLADPRAAAVAAGWAEQYLAFRGLAASDAIDRPGADAALLEAMEAETRAHVSWMIREDRPLRELVDSRLAFVDDRLAAHYGLPAPGSATPVPVEDPSGARGGVLRQAAILTAASDFLHTSPVRRGVLVLEQLVCTPPGEPPANLPPLDATLPITDALAQHTADPRCASCHQVIDPLGLSLEAYDPLGALRDAPTTSGTLPDGTTIDGAPALVAWVATHPNYPRCVAEELTTWVLHRALGAPEQCVLDGLELTADTGLRTLLREVLRSPAFLQRADPEPTP